MKLKQLNFKNGFVRIFDKELIDDVINYSLKSDYKVILKGLRDILPKDLFELGIDYEQHWEGLGHPCDEIRMMQAFEMLWEKEFEEHLDIVNEYNEINTVVVLVIDDEKAKEVLGENKRLWAETKMWEKTKEKIEKSVEELNALEAARKIGEDLKYIPKVPDIFKKEEKEE